MTAPRQSLRAMRRSFSDDRGFVAGSEALIFGVLICVIGTLVVVNGWAVVDARFVASAVAREAARAMVEAPAGTDLEAVAGEAAAAVVRAHGRDPASLTLTVTGPSAPSRCASVEVRATILVMPISVPLPARRNGGATGGSGAYAVHASYSEVVDPFRAGLPAGLECPW